MSKSNTPAKTEDLGFLEEIVEEQGANNAGFEDMDSSTMSIPFLKLLQSTSPECKKSNEKYVEGAKPGMFINSVTKELYDECVVMVMAFEHNYCEWTPNRGPLVARHPKEAFSQICINPKEFGRYMTGNGNDLVETYTYYLLIEGAESEGPVCLSLTKTVIPLHQLILTT